MKPSNETIVDDRTMCLPQCLPPTPQPAAGKNGVVAEAINSAPRSAIRAPASLLASSVVACCDSAR